ncbi:MAG: SYNERG-CTERM sorting domain-containing protein, partial [Synergistaceae bacterium]|nr:SYNERG-CTERM sorting domain-containing protein [Synergistaceae bacterium]
QGGIDVIDLSKEPSSAVAPLDLGTDQGQVAPLCAAGSDLYFIETKVLDDSWANWRAEGALYKWTGTGKQKLRDGSGYPTLLAYDPATQAVVAALNGDEVVVLDRDGEEIDTFDNTDLGGNIYSLAVVAKATPPDSPGGGGCDAGLTAFGVLLVLPLALRKKSR